MVLGQVHDYSATGGKPKQVTLDVTLPAYPAVVKKYLTTTVRSGATRPEERKLKTAGHSSHLHLGGVGGSVTTTKPRTGSAGDSSGDTIISSPIISTEGKGGISLLEYLEAVAATPAETKAAGQGGGGGNGGAALATVVGGGGGNTVASSSSRPQKDPHLPPPDSCVRGEAGVNRFESFEVRDPPVRAERAMKASALQQIRSEPTPTVIRSDPRDSYLGAAATGVKNFKLRTVTAGFDGIQSQPAYSNMTHELVELGVGRNGESLSPPIETSKEASGVLLSSPTSRTVGMDVRTIVTLAAERNERNNNNKTAASGAGFDAHSMNMNRSPLQHCSLPLSYLPSSVSPMVVENEFDGGVVDTSASAKANTRARPAFKRDTSYAAFQGNAAFNGVGVAVPLGFSDGNHARAMALSGYDLSKGARLRYGEKGRPGLSRRPSTVGFVQKHDGTLLLEDRVFSKDEYEKMGASPFQLDDTDYGDYLAPYTPGGRSGRGNNGGDDGILKDARRRATTLGTDSDVAGEETRSLRTTKSDESGDNYPKDHGGESGTTPKTAAGGEGGGNGVVEDDVASEASDDCGIMDIDWDGVDDVIAWEHLTPQQQDVECMAALKDKTVVKQLEAAGLPVPNAKDAKQKVAFLRVKWTAYCSWFKVGVNPKP
jgi:hypothetical protein